MEKQSSFRGHNIDQDFVAKFKSSGFYKEIYLKHKDEIIIGVRDGYIKLAQLYAYSNKPLDCYAVLDDMEKNTVYREDWRLVTYYWKPWKTLQIKADAK